MCAYQLLDADHRCASALVTGICDSYQIVADVDSGIVKYAPNPKSINPFQKGGEFFDSDFMEKLYGVSIDGKAANTLARDWANEGTKRGEEFAKIILKTVHDLTIGKVTTTDKKGRTVTRSVSYTTFDNGFRFYRSSEMATYFGKDFMDEENPDVGMNGEDALTHAMNFYKDLLWENENKDKVLPLIESNPNEAEKVLNSLSQFLTDKIYNGTLSLIQDRQKEIAEDSKEASRQETTDAVIRETAKEVAKSFTPNAPRKGRKPNKVQEPVTAAVNADQGGEA